MESILVPGDRALSSGVRAAPPTTRDALQDLDAAGQVGFDGVVPLFLKPADEIGR